MNIKQIEKFYSQFYPNWRSDAYWELLKKLQVLPEQKLSTMSCGQRSQVALGLILAQNPDLLILDDYSMGLDAGYRRLFLDYLAEYAKAEDKTVFITSHIIQDLENFVEDVVILDYKSVLLQTSVKDFSNNFHQYRFRSNKPAEELLKKDDVITNFEIIKDKITVYSFKSKEAVKDHLQKIGIKIEAIEEIPMSLEDAFIGLTGKY